MAELGYRVSCFCYQDSPRRAHSIAAQGGINAAKNYRNDGDSVHRLFYDTVKGGDFRSREANVYRLAEVSNHIIDQCVAQGVPFAREYGGLLDNRSFGGAQVSRTFYARGQTGQQLLLGAYQALERQIGLGTVAMHPRHEMLELIVVDGRARGVVVRDMVTGKIESHLGDAVVLATGGYGNVFYLATYAKGCNATAIWRAYKKGAGFGNPCFTQIHPTCIPVTGDHQSKLTLMSESLRNDGRIWVPTTKGDKRPPHEIPEAERDYYLERKYPSFGNLAPRDIASRAAKQVCDEGRGVGPTGQGVYLDFTDAIARLGRGQIEEKYGNLFEMYERITGENPYEMPMRIYPATHYTMGGLWVDYNLMSTIPGLFVVGEANFSDHGANRLGASALMQGLADGYFILPYTIGDYLAQTKQTPLDADAHRGARPPRRRSPSASPACWRSRAAAPSRRSTASWGRSCGTTAAWRGTRQGLEDGLREDPGAARGVLGERARAGRGRGAQPVARGGGPRRRLPRAGRAHVPRRAGARGVVRRPLPRGVPDARRRGAARRREASATSPCGNTPGPTGADPARGAARLRERPPGDEELQVAMHITLHVWRQKNAGGDRSLRHLPRRTTSARDMSFLEMLDVVNEGLIQKGEEPIAFDHDCREGICGTCGVVINGMPHGPRPRTTTCQLHMRELQGRRRDRRSSRGGRRPFPVVKDLVVDRSAFDRIIAAGGFITAPTGSAPEANAIPVPKENADLAMDAAACIGCGACVAACPNASASLFVAAKVAHLALLPQGQPERWDRVLAMIGQARRRGLRRLHQPRRVRGGVPEGHPRCSSSAR